MLVDGEDDKMSLSDGRHARAIVSGYEAIGGGVYFDPVDSTRQLRNRNAQEDPGDCKH